MKEDTLRALEAEWKTLPDDVIQDINPTWCPFIVPFNQIILDGNEPIEYPGSDYIFWDHMAPDGKITRVQFCQLIGRKRDVFECYNESEWRGCSHFRFGTEERQTKALARWKPE